MKRPGFAGGADVEIKAMTLRLPADKAAELEAVARADSKAVSDVVREAINLLIEDRRKDKDFRARLSQMIEDDRAILDRLAR
jgi:Arc/MetJ-type ribon-helix-helix transcriptional regulator